MDLTPFMQSKFFNFDLPIVLPEPEFTWLDHILGREPKFEPQKPFTLQAPITDAGYVKALRSSEGAIQDFTLTVPGDDEDWVIDWTGYISDVQEGDDGVVTVAVMPIRSANHQALS